VDENRIWRGLAWPFEDNDRVPGAGEEDAGDYKVPCLQGDEIWWGWASQPTGRRRRAGGSGGGCLGFVGY
jgi:hypothetical protein